MRKKSILATKFGKWENGENQPNSDDANALPQFFGVTLNYLFSGKTTRENEAVLSRKPSEEELIFDAKTYFLKRYDAIIRNSNRYRHKEKFFSEKSCYRFLRKYIPK